MGSEPKFRCVIHGSFRKHFAEIQRVHRLFSENGIEVFAPKASDVVSERGGFAYLENETERDPRLIELLYLHHLKRLGRGGFSYFVNPEGYLGRSASYELGIAQLTNVQCFFQEPLTDHPAYLHRNSVWEPESLVTFIQEHQGLPMPAVHTNEREIHRLWEDLMVPGSVVAVGAIIEHEGRTSTAEPEVLLVKTHKWGGRYSVVGGRVRRHERLDTALLREIWEETGLRGKIGRHLCTFDQIENSKYHAAGVQHIFVDNVVQVEKKNVRLNEEAQDYLWAPASVALKELSIEPNARHTLKLYAKTK